MTALPILNNWYIHDGCLCGDTPLFVRISNAVVVNDNLVGRLNLTTRKPHLCYTLGKPDSFPPLLKRSKAWLQAQHAHQEEHGEHWSHTETLASD